MTHTIPPVPLPAHPGPEMRPHRRRNFAARTFAKVGLVGMSIAAPGMAADRVIDAFQDPADPVEQVGGDNTPEAVVRVSQTVRDLDGGKEDAIRARAEQFRQTHAGDMVEDLEAEGLRRAIEASNDAQVVDILGRYLSEFGLTLVVDDPNATEAADVRRTEGYRDVAKEIINTTSLFPKSLFRPFFAVETIVLDGDMAKTVEYRRNAEDPDRSAIHFNVHVSDWEDDDQFVQRGISAANKVAHADTRIDGGPVNLATNLLDSVIDYRESDSVHGFSSAVANQAETGAELLHEGIRHPNNGIAYNSPLNKNLLEDLTDMEDYLPGLTDHIVTEVMLDGQPHFTGSDTVLPDDPQNRDKIVRLGLTGGLIAMWALNRRNRFV